MFQRQVLPNLILHGLLSELDGSSLCQESDDEPILLINKHLNIVANISSYLPHAGDL